MATDSHVPLCSFRLLRRSAASVPRLDDLQGEIHKALSESSISPNQLRGCSVAVAAGSRGIASLSEIVRATCDWLKAQGAYPFVFPAMGSHGGATAEGQKKILEEYGVTPSLIHAEVRSSMESVSLGPTPEGFGVFMDRNAWEADGVVVINRVKPHTDFCGKIESGLLKMMAVGMGKIEGAQECHRWSRKCGQEKVIRAMSARVLASDKILCGLAVVENELHEICALRAAQPERIVAVEEDTLQMARALVPGLPFSKLHLLIVNELGKNISGSGMDTKVIGRGVKLPAGEAPEIRLIYARDLTPESAGNALGIGLADVMHERLYRKIDLEKTYTNVRTSLNPPMGRLPMYFPRDCEALSFSLGALGSPEPDKQRVTWIRNTLNLDRVAVSECLVREATALKGWQLVPETYQPQFDSGGNLISPL